MADETTQTPEENKPGEDSQIVNPQSNGQATEQPPVEGEENETPSEETTEQPPVEGEENETPSEETTEQPPVEGEGSETLPEKKSLATKVKEVFVGEKKKKPAEKSKKKASGRILETGFDSKGCVVRMYEITEGDQKVFKVYKIAAGYMSKALTEKEAKSEFKELTK